MTTSSSAPSAQRQAQSQPASVASWGELLGRRHGWCAVALTGGHHFGGDYAALAALIVDAIPR